MYLAYHQQQQSIHISSLICINRKQFFFLFHKGSLKRGRRKKRELKEKMKPRQIMNRSGKLPAFGGGLEMQVHMENEGLSA